MFPWSRLELLYGNEMINKFKKTTVMIAGLGGVGSYSAESMARSFIGKLVLVDYDKYDITNLNRQLHSNQDNLNLFKVDNISDCLMKINPYLQIRKYNLKISEENVGLFFENDRIDYVIDAIDDIPAKIGLIKYCKENQIEIISSMGTGNRINPQAFKIEDINKTFNCPLAKKMRKELKKIGILKHKVVFSEELPLKIPNATIIGSNSFVPASAGLLLTSYIINKIIEG